jgi:hypothetical protein
MQDGKSRKPFRSGRWLMLLALCTAVALAGVPAYAQQKPNIVLILSDDFGYGDSGPMAADRAAACPRPAWIAWRMRA